MQGFVRKEKRLCTGTRYRCSAKQDDGRELGQAENSLQKCYSDDTFSGIIFQGTPESSRFTAPARETVRHCKYKVVQAAARGNAFLLARCLGPQRSGKKSEDRFLERDWIPCTDERSRKLFRAEAENTLFRDIEKGIETHAVLRAGQSPQRRSGDARQTRNAAGRRNSRVSIKPKFTSFPCGTAMCRRVFVFPNGFMFSKAVPAGKVRRRRQKIPPAGMRAKAAGMAFYVSAGVSARYASKMPAASAARSGQGRLR